MGNNVTLNKIKKLPSYLDDPEELMVSYFHPKNGRWECASPFLPYVGTSGTIEDERHEDIAIADMTKLIAKASIQVRTPKHKESRAPERPTFSVRLSQNTKECLEYLADQYELTQGQLVEWLILIQMRQCGVEFLEEGEEED